MTNKIAQIISVVLNPICISVLIPYLMIFRITHNSTLALTWTLYTIIFLLALSLFIIYGIKKKIFIDFDVSKREQRPLLFQVGFVFVLFYILGLYLFHGPTILIILASGVIIAVALAGIINTRIKASIHVATTSVLIVATAIDLKGLYLLLLLLIPAVGWARVKENKHTVPETVTGGVLGTLLSLGLYMVIRSNMH